MKTLRILLLMPVLVVVVLLLASVTVGLLRTIMFTKNCDGTVVVAAGSATCLPKVDFNKPAEIIENLAFRETMRDFQRFINEQDPNVIQQHNGLWDACPLTKMPTCED